MNDVLQAIAVAIVVALAIVWIVRRVRRKDSQCNCGCQGCDLAKSCQKQDTKKK